MFNAAYARKTLVRVRKILGSGALSIVCFWFALNSFWGYQIASIVTIIPITFFGLVLANLHNSDADLNFVSKIFENHRWLLWTGHFIEHQRMPESESNELIHDAHRVLRVGDNVHVARSEKDLMLFKLSIGDYL